MKARNTCVFISFFCHKSFTIFCLIHLVFRMKVSILGQVPKKRNNVFCYYYRLRNIIFSPLLIKKKKEKMVSTESFPSLGRDRISIAFLFLGLDKILKIGGFKNWVKI